MTIQTINLGNYANDGTGDDLRVAFTKVNANFAALDASAAIANGVNVGTGIGIFFAKDTTNLQFKSLTSTNSSVTISSTANTVNLAAVTQLQSDLTPTLGANLNLKHPVTVCFVTSICHINQGKSLESRVLAAAIQDVGSR